MADLTLEVETSRAISAQMLRHKSLSAQEFSLRYQELLGFEVYEARRQDVKNRQNSIDDMSEDDKSWFDNAQSKVINVASELYKEGIRRGIAKESMRFLLPMSTKTKLYLKGSVRSWLHYLEVRCHQDTQLEHREIAEEIKKIFIQQFPNIAQAKNWA